MLYGSTIQKDRPIDKMDMKLFYGSAICVDLTHIRYPDYIEAKDLEEAVEKAGLTVEKGRYFHNVYRAL